MKQSIFLDEMTGVFFQYESFNYERNIQLIDFDFQ